MQGIVFFLLRSVAIPQPAVDEEQVNIVQKFGVPCGQYFKRTIVSGSNTLGILLPESHVNWEAASHHFLCRTLPSLMLSTEGKVH
jgi:hypothetical protein